MRNKTGENSCRFGAQLPFREAGAGDVPVVVGGIIPDADARWLREQGVAAVFTPKDISLTTMMGQIVTEIRRARGLDVAPVTE